MAKTALSMMLLLFSFSLFAYLPAGKEPLTELKTELNEQCETYQLFLRQSLGCKLCVLCNYVLDTLKYNHIENRLIEIDKLQSAMFLCSSVGIRRVERFIRNMEPFAGVGYGAKFSAKCLSAIKQYKEHASYVNEFTKLNCVVCENTTIGTVFNPCGHLVCCSACAQTLSACPICRGDIKEKINLAFDDICGQCQVCENKPANQLSNSCSHIVTCEDCTTKKCIICGEFSERHMKIIIDGYADEG